MTPITNADKADILIRALPYIQDLAGRTVVIKYGGNSMVNEELKDAVMRDIVLLCLVGIRVVLVHGGGPEINDMLNRVGKESRFVSGLRYTDEETVEIVQMVLAGKVNKDLVQKLNGHGGRAIGICGIDAGMIRARRMDGEQDLGLVGEITEINVKPVCDLLEQGYIPVIATIGCGDNGEVYNINADTAAAEIAAAIGAAKLILLTDTRGLLRDRDDLSTLISEVHLRHIPRFKRDGIITGGMIPKIDCCVEAIRKGVQRAHIIDGRVEHSILLELFSDEGIGTLIS